MTWKPAILALALVSATLAIAPSASADDETCFPVTVGQDDEQVCAPVGIPCGEDPANCVPPPPCDDVNDCTPPPPCRPGHDCVPEDVICFPDIGICIP